MGRTVGLRGSASEHAAEARRELVGLYRCQGMSERRITERLAADGVINAATGEPYSLTTVAKDVSVLVRRWRQASGEATEDHLAICLAELNEVKRQGFESGNLQAVLGALKLEARLLGLEAPEKVAVSHAGMPAITEMVVVCREYGPDGEAGEAGEPVEEPAAPVW
jgi:hypothetical protein